MTNLTERSSIGRTSDFLSDKESPILSRSAIFEDVREFFNKCILEDKDFNDRGVYIDVIDLVTKAFDKGRKITLDKL